MAVEYTLYKMSDMVEAEKTRKLKTKLKSQIEKTFDNIISKEDDTAVIDSLQSIKEKTLSTIEKEIQESIEGVPICTVTSTKTYIEMPYAELEKRMNEDAYIIIGDDKSKSKNATFLKKFYE